MTTSAAGLKNRSYDSDGQMKIRLTPISKAAVNPYYGREIPGSEAMHLDPERVYHLLRDPQELAKAAPSFANKQLMMKHIAVSAEDPKQDHIAGTVGSNVTFEHPYLLADMAIWDAEAIAGIETDTVRELSSSYRYRADMTPGVYEGQHYDGVMRDIEGNHVALVPQGRAGSDVRAADAALELKAMETKFGKALYAILCAASPKLAEDSRLRPMVIGLTRKQCDLRSLEPKLLAMDSALNSLAMDAVRAAKDAEEDDRPKKAEDRISRDAQTAEERAMWAQMRKDGSADDPEDDAMPASLRKAKDRKAKDARKTAKDMTFDEWAKDAEEDEDDDKAEDRRKARDAEEDDEDREKRKEYEKKADDARKIARDDFDDLVEKLEKKGYSKEYATKVAGKVASEKGDDKAKDKRKAKDAEEDKAEDKKAMDAQIKRATDEFKRELREAEDARRTVRPVVGEVLAHDSASDIYAFALDQMNVNHDGINDARALRALFTTAYDASKPKPRQAFDSVSVEEKFAGAARNIQVM